MEIMERLGRDSDMLRKHRPSKTYRIDFASGRLRGKTDGIEAAGQAIYKALMTRRWAYPVYDGQYGSELAALFSGRDTTPEYIAAEAERLVREALAADDRVTDVGNVEYSYDGENAYISVDVGTVYGNDRVEAVISDV